jgi:hypothetical protein
MFDALALLAQPEKCASIAGFRQWVERLERRLLLSAVSVATVQAAAPDVATVVASGLSENSTTLVAGSYTGTSQLQIGSKMTSALTTLTIGSPTASGAISGSATFQGLGAFSLAGTAVDNHISISLSGVNGTSGTLAMSATIGSLLSISDQLAGVVNGTPVSGNAALSFEHAQALTAAAPPTSVPAATPTVASLEGLLAAPTNAQAVTNAQTPPPFSNAPIAASSLLDVVGPANVGTGASSSTSANASFSNASLLGVASGIDELIALVGG